jgi:hypothetical protein
VECSEVWCGVGGGAVQGILCAKVHDNYCAVVGRVCDIILLCLVYFDVLYISVFACALL